MAPKKQDKSNAESVDQDLKKHDMKKAIVRVQDCTKQTMKPVQLVVDSNLTNAYTLYTKIESRQRPTFLHRTLTYMKHRMSRNHKARKTFRVDDIYPNRTQTQVQPAKYLTLTFFGYFDPSIPVGEKNTVRVETFIVKKIKSKSKNNRPLPQIQVGTIEVALNPPSGDNRPVPILSIAPETINTENSASKVRSLVLRVASENTKPYELKQPVSNNKGDSLIREGIYNTTAGSMEKIWSTIPENMKEIIKVDSNDPVLQFQLEWTAECKSGWVPRPENNINKVLPVAGGGKPQGPGRPPKSSKVKEPYTISYEIQFSNGRQETPPAEPQTVCPFCQLDCGQLYSLFKHLKCCHDRVSCSYSIKDNHIKIDMTANTSADVAYEGNPMDRVYKSDVVQRRTVWTMVLGCRPKRSKPNLAEFLDPEDGTDFDTQRPFARGHNRLYYHSTTCLPVHPREIDYDSEGERDPAWLQEKTKTMMDEFTDVNEGEKEIFKLWKLHYLKYGFVGDCQIFRALQMFIEEHGSQIIRKNLIRNLLLHFNNLFELNLLTPVQFWEIMKLIREQMSLDPEGCRTFSSAWLASRSSWLASGGSSGPREKASTAPPPSSSSQKHSSTFITGDGTRRRQMAGGTAPRGRKGRPPANATKYAGDSDDDKVLAVRRGSLAESPMKKTASDNKSAADRALRKRKLSLQGKDTPGEGAAKRSRRAESDPQRRKSLEHNGNTLRKSTSLDSP